MKNLSGAKPNSFPGQLDEAKCTGGPVGCSRSLTAARVAGMDLQTSAAFEDEQARWVAPQHVSCGCCQIDGELLAEELAAVIDRLTCTVTNSTPRDV